MSVQEVVNGINDQVVDDGGFNLILLYESMIHSDNIISTVIGVLIAITVIGMPIIIALEVLYINIPVFQSNICKIAEQNDAAKKISGFILRDAHIAIARADTLETGRSANQEYLLIKAKVVFIVFLIIGIAMGPFNAIAQFLADQIQHIITVLF